MVSFADASHHYPRDPEYLKRKVPPKQASLPAEVGAPVTIAWDRWGIAHVRAARRSDLFYGLGYATAQECLWRLEYCRRQARGELATLLGEGAVRSDLTMRLLGSGRHADALAATLPEEVAEALNALSGGINRWLEQAVAQKRLPVECDWLDIEPAPWTPADTIACWKHRWWTLTGRLDNIAIGEAAKRHLPPALHAAFMASELGEETIVPGERAQGRVPGGADTGEGSNNWVVAGSRTTTGYPVLCSDPHNPFTQPGQWFQAQLTLEDGSLDVAGATYAASPGVYMGRNRHIAWGFTNHVASVRDLYVEQVDPARPGQYLEAGEWKPFQEETHTIEVRGGQPQTVRVQRTRTQRPVVNAILPALDDDPSPITLRWNGLEVGTGLDALMRLNAATSVDAALEALTRWPCPIANVMLADVQGHIAYHAIGHVPRVARAAREYRRADDPEAAWQGTIGYDDLPQLAEPARGWLASANQPPWERDPEGLSYLRGAAWADGGRMRRIRERLEAQPALSPAALGAIQADVTTVRARELVPQLVRLCGTPTEELRAPLEALAGWDGGYTLKTVAGTIWAAFWERWLVRIAAARFPERLASLVQTQAGAVARDLLLGRDTTPPWFGDRSIAGEVRETLLDAVTWLRASVGEDATQWRWGTVHTVTWRHALSEQGPAAQRMAAAEALDVGPFETTGGPGTVRAAAPIPAEPYRVGSGATYRFVADLSPSGGLAVTSTTGQSGHPGSPHYADQTKLWLGDEYLQFRLDEFEPEGVTRLEPPR